MKALTRYMTSILILALTLGSIGCLFGSDDDEPGDPPGGGAVALRVDAGVGTSGDGGSWATAFGSLDAALIAASAADGSVDEIWVAAGTYTPGSRGSFNMVDNVGLYGGFDGTEESRDERDWEANETILQGSGGSVVSADLTTGGTLNGFTITGGNSGTGRGGGAYFSISAFDVPPTVRNCLFTSNVASDFGGGLYSNSGTIVANCTFVGNVSGTGSGLFMQGYGDDPRIVANCSFFGNGMDGDLSGGGGAEIWSDGDATIVNCVFSGNVADFGSGLSIVGDATIANCTFTENTSRLSLGSSGLRATTSTANIFNCIFWNNRNADGPTEIAQISGYPTMNVVSCCVDSLETFLGNGNFDADPIFADHDGPDNSVGTIDDNLHLSGGSTSSGTGDPALLPADAADLDGDGDITEPTPVDRDGVPIANLSRGAFSS